MRAVICRAYGGPEHLEIVDRPLPAPGQGEIRVGLCAGTVSAGDWRIRSLSVPRGYGLVVRMAFGWGTNLTNDFVDCAPRRNEQLRAISLVCKVTEANGKPAVKLSDNPRKATGDPAEIERYLRIFGTEERVEKAVYI